MKLKYTTAYLLTKLPAFLITIYGVEICKTLVERNTLYRIMPSFLFYLLSFSPIIITILCDLFLNNFTFSKIYLKAIIFMAITVNIIDSINNILSLTLGLDIVYRYVIHNLPVFLSLSYTTFILVFLKEGGLSLLLNKNDEKTL